MLGSGAGDSLAVHDVLHRVVLHHLWLYSSDLGLILLEWSARWGLVRRAHGHVFGLVGDCTDVLSEHRLLKVHDREVLDVCV